MEKDGTLNILLVEDSADHAALIRAALREGMRPVEMTVACCLEEARSRLDAATFDLAIVDLLLPDGRGTDLLTGEGGGLSCPVVIMTGQGDEAAAVAAMKTGAIDYVVKSAETLAELPRIVERALRVWRHVAERRRAEEALRENRRRFQELVETLSDWVWEVDADGVYTYASPNVRELLGYEPEEVLGTTPFDLMPEAEAERVRRIFREVVVRRQPFRGLVNINRHKRGHDTVLESSGKPFFADDGTFLGYRGVDRDISERKRAEARLLEVNRELAAFAQTLAHDLRTPLTAIIGFSEMLGERYRERLDGEAREMIGAIHQQGGRMLALMEDLLTLAKVGHLGRPETPVAAGEVVRGVLQELGSQLADAGLAVRLRPLPAVHIPETLLSQVFENLLANAVRYAAEGGGVEVGGERRGSRVRFYVRDHGSGVPEEERQHIFELFSRGSSGRHVSGTGVGLAIVHKVARLYDGQAWVEETIGGGSTFWVEMADAAAEGTPS